MLIVPDTNILISGASISQSYTGQIFSAWREGTVEFATSEEILEEVRRVLDYPQVHAFEHWTGTEKEQYIIKVRSSSIVIDEWQPVHISADPDDDKFFSCAVAAGAAYIVSKDKHILDIGEYQHIKTVKPGYFVERVLKVAA